MCADVRVPAIHVIGEAGGGLRRAMSQINATRMAIAADCIGQCRFAIDLVEQTLVERAGRRSSAGEPARVGTDLERVTLGGMRIDGCVLSGSRKDRQRCSPRMWPGAGWTSASAECDGSAASDC